jgi:hypothetical protein
MNPGDPANSPSPASRREFLKLSGGAAAATALAGVAVPRGHAAEDNKIKLAVVGCGGCGIGDQDSGERCFPFSHFLLFPNRADLSGR